MLQQSVTLHFVFVCFVRFSLQTAIISLNSVNRLIFVTVKCGVFFEVRTELLNIILASSFTGFCPDWGFPCFSSVVRRMPGHNEKRGTARLPITEAFSQDDPNTSGFNSQENRPTKIHVWRISCLMGQTPATSNDPSLTVKAFCRDWYPLAQAKPQF
jgi:hypothetical protein